MQKNTSCFVILPQVEYQLKATGYANQFYFAKEFRRIIGKTPSEYRREGGGDEEIFTIIGSKKPAWFCLQESCPSLVFVYFSFCILIRHRFLKNAIP